MPKGIPPSTSPPRLRPVMMSALEVRRLVLDKTEDEAEVAQDQETYFERIAKELRVKTSELRNTRVQVSDPQFLRTPLVMAFDYNRAQRDHRCVRVAWPCHACFLRSFHFVMGAR